MMIEKHEGENVLVLIDNDTVDPDMRTLPIVRTGKLTLDKIMKVHHDSEIRYSLSTNIQTTAVVILKFQENSMQTGIT